MSVLDGGIIMQRLVLDLSNYNANFARAEHTMTANVARIGSLGQSLTKYIVAPMALIGGYSVKSAVDFEHAMAKLNTLANQSAGQLKGTSNQMLAISNSTGVAATQVAQMGYDALSSSVKIGQMGKVVRIAANLSKAGFADADDSLKLLTSTYNVYSDTFEKAGISQSDAMKQISDKMITLQNYGVTTVGEMSTMLGNVTPLAHSAGMSIDEIVAALSQLTLGGLQSGEAVTGLRAILSDVVKPGEHARQVAKALGIEFNASAIKSKGFSGFLAEMRQKLEQTHPAFLKVSDTVAELQQKINGATKEQKANKGQMQQWRTELTEAKKELKYLSKGGDSTIGTLGQLFGSVEALGSMLSLTSDNGMKNFNKFLNESATSAGVTDKALKTMEDTTQEKFTKATTQLKNASIVLGTELLPTVTKVVLKVSDLAKSFQHADPQKLSNSIKTGLNVALGILAVTITSKTILAITNIVNGFKGMQVALSGLSAFVAANPIAAIVVGATAAIATSYIWIQKYNSEVEKLNKNIKNMDKIKSRDIIANAKEETDVKKDKASLLNIKNQLQTQYRKKDAIIGNQKDEYKQYTDLYNVLHNPTKLQPTKANIKYKNDILKKYYPNQSNGTAYQNANKDYITLSNMLAKKQNQIAEVNNAISKLKKKLETNHGMKAGSNVSDIDKAVKWDNELLTKNKYNDNLKKNGVKNLKQYTEATATNERVAKQLEQYTGTQKYIGTLKSEISKLEEKQVNSKLTNSKVKFTNSDKKQLNAMKSNLKKQENSLSEYKSLIEGNGFTVNSGTKETKVLSSVLKKYNTQSKSVQQYTKLNDLFSQHSNVKDSYGELQKNADNAFKKFGMSSKQYKDAQEAANQQSKAMDKIEKQIEKVTGKNWNDSKTYFKKLGEQKLEVKPQVKVKPKVTTDKGGGSKGGSGSSGKTIDQIKSEFEDKMSNTSLKLKAGDMTKAQAINEYKWLQKYYAKYPDLALKAKAAMNSLQTGLNKSKTTQAKKDLTTELSDISNSIDNFENKSEEKLSKLKLSGKGENTKEYQQALKQANNDEIKFEQSKLSQLDTLRKGKNKEQLQQIDSAANSIKKKINDLKLNNLDVNGKVFDVDIANIQKPLEQIQTANKNKLNDLVTKGLKEGSLAYIQEQEKESKAELDVKKKVYSNLMAYRNKYIKTMSADDKEQLGKDLTDLNADIKASAADATKTHAEELQARYDASQKWIEKQKESNTKFTKQQELAAWQRVYNQHKGTDLGEQAQEQIISVKAEIRQTDLDNIDKPLGKLEADNKIKLSQAIAGGIKEGSVAYIELEEKLAGQELVSQKQALDGLKAYYQKYQNEMTVDEKATYENKLAEETQAYYDAVNNQASYKKQAMEALYNEEKDRISNAQEIAGMTATDAMHEWQNVAKEFEGTDWGLEALKEVKGLMDKLHEDALNTIKDSEDKALNLLDTAKDNAIDSINTEKDAWSNAYDDKVDKFTKAQDKIIDGYKDELKAIEDNYDAQNRAEDMASADADIEKYSGAVGSEGKQKYAEALKKKRDLEREAQKASLQAQIDNAETLKSRQLSVWEEENKSKLKGYEADSKAIEDKYKTDTLTTKQHYQGLINEENESYSKSEMAFAEHNQNLVTIANNNLSAFQNAGTNLGATFSNSFTTALKPTLDFINNIKTALANTLANRANLTALGATLTQSPRIMPNGSVINNSNSTSNNANSNALNVTLNDYSSNNFTSPTQSQSKAKNIVDDIRNRATARGIKPIIG